MNTSIFYNIVQKALKSGLALVLGATLGLSTSHVSALEVDADDYTIGGLPAGSNLGAVYYQHADRTSVFYNGRQVSGGNLTSDVGALRYGRQFDLGPFLATSQFFLPIAGLQATHDLKALGDSWGLGDLVLASTFWLYNKPDAGTFFGLTPILYVPVGTYGGLHALNVGEHRWKGALQAGYVSPLFTPALSLELVADVTFFGDNDRYAGRRTQSQQPLGLLQGWLRYNFTPAFDVRLGTAYFVGGKTTIDGIANRDFQSTNNIKAGFSYSFDQSSSLLVVYGRDLEVRNGLKEANRVNVRLIKIF